MDEKFIQEMKDILTKKRDELTDRLEKLEASKSRTLDPNSTEAAVEKQNHGVVDALDDIELKELAEINHALKKIDEGTYGVCEVSGEPIGEKRLRAVPFARTCIEHAE